MVKQLFYDIYIVELTDGGHRITFLKYLVDHARKRGLSVCIATLPSTIESGLFDQFKVPLEPIVVGNISTKLPKILLSSLVAQIEIYFAIRKYLANVNPRLGVIFPTLQASGAIPLGLLGFEYPHDWSGVIMAPAAHLRSYAIDSPHIKLELKLQHIAYIRMVKSMCCKRISSFDPLFVDWMNTEKIVNSPDPVSLFSCHSTVGNEFKLLNKGEKIVIAVVGTIDLRKQIPLLARVLNSNTNGQYHLLVAGKVKHGGELEGIDVRELLEADNATVIPRRLTDEEVDYCFQFADIVWSGNTRTYGSSGAVVRGGMHKKAVIVMDGSVMGKVLSGGFGGPVVNMSSEEDVCDALHMLESSTVRERYGCANFKLFENNTVDTYTKTVFEPFKNI